MTSRIWSTRSATRSRLQFPEEWASLLQALAVLSREPAVYVPGFREADPHLICDEPDRFLQGQVRIPLATPWPPMKGDLFKGSCRHQVGHTPFLAGEGSCPCDNADKDPCPDGCATVAEKAAGPAFYHPCPVPGIFYRLFFLSRFPGVIVECGDQDRGYKEMVLRPVQPERRAREYLFDQDERVVFTTLEAYHLDQVFCVQTVAAVADIVPVHAAGGGHGLLPAVGALHLMRLVKVFEISATDETAGRGGGHVVAIGGEGDNCSGMENEGQH